VQVLIFIVMFLVFASGDCGHVGVVCPCVCLDPCCLYLKLITLLFLAINVDPLIYK
jgi:hypothetical protein